MKRLKRKLLMAMVGVALVAFAVPVIGLRTGAASRSTEARTKLAATLVGPEAPTPSLQQQEVSGGGQSSDAPAVTGKVKREVYDALGIPRVPKGHHATEYSQEIAARVTAGLKSGGKAHAGDVTPQAGEPVNMSACAAF